MLTIIWAILTLLIAHPQLTGGLATPFVKIGEPGNSASTRISPSFHFALHDILQKTIFILVLHNKSEEPEFPFFNR